MQNQEIYLVEDVAKRYSVHTETVRRWIREKRLPAKKIGGKNYRISQSDLEEFEKRATIQ